MMAEGRAWGWSAAAGSVSPRAGLGAMGPAGIAPSQTSGRSTPDGIAAGVGRDEAGTQAPLAQGLDGVGRGPACETAGSAITIGSTKPSSPETDRDAGCVHPADALGATTITAASPIRAAGRPRRVRTQRFNMTTESRGDARRAEMAIKLVQLIIFILAAAPQSHKPDDLDFHRTVND